MGQVVVVALRRCCQTTLCCQCIALGCSLPALRAQERARRSGTSCVNDVWASGQAGGRALPWPR